MIVLDASAILEALLGTELGAQVLERIEHPGVGLHVPHLLDVEVAQVLRRFVLVGELSSPEAEAALEGLLLLDLQRHAHAPLLGWVWSFRANLTAYDAVYVALAEALDTQLVTCDARIARALGDSTRIDLVE